MIKTVMQEAFNKQITKEMFSSNLYLSMAAYFQESNLNGFANWMRIQAQEEMSHALKFFDYLLNRNGQPCISAIEAPQKNWLNPLDCFESALHHEEMITESINELADLAIKEGDHASLILLQWFVNEQVEEEATSNEIVDRLKLAGDSKSGLFILDNELKQRVFVPEPIVK
jgi:ferritin